MKNMIILAALAAFFVSGCTAVQVRDNAAQTGQKLYSGYDRALSHQLDQRVAWRKSCADLAELERETIKQFVQDQESLEDKLAAIDIGRERLNKSLPKIHTIDAFSDGDGSVLNEINEITC